MNSLKKYLFILIIVYNGCENIYDTFTQSVINFTFFAGDKILF